MAFNYTFRSLPNGGRGNWNTGGQIVGYGTLGNIRPVSTMARKAAAVPSRPRPEPMAAVAAESPSVAPQPVVEPQSIPAQPVARPSLMETLPIPATLWGLRPSYNWNVPAPNTTEYGSPFYSFARRWRDTDFIDRTGKGDYAGIYPFLGRR